ncbi:MAG: soluble P-type ATPase [Alphaproteobacteria bacterium]|jgi:soluble P-type ATPase
MTQNRLGTTLGLMSAAYAGHSIISTLKDIKKSPYPKKALQNNLVSLTHSAIGLSSGLLGVISGNGALAINGALQIASHLLSEKYFNQQQKDYEKTKSKAAQALQQEPMLKGCCVGDFDTDKRIHMLRVDKYIAKKYMNRSDEKKKQDREIIRDKQTLNRAFTAIQKNEKPNDADTVMYDEMVEQYPDSMFQNQGLQQQETEVIQKLLSKRLELYKDHIEKSNKSEDKEADIQGVTAIFEKLKQCTTLKEYQNYNKNAQLSDADKKLYAEIVKQFPDKDLNISLSNSALSARAPIMVSSQNPVPFSGTIDGIFKLNEDVDYEEVKDNIFAKNSDDTYKNGKEVNTVTVDTQNVNGDTDLKELGKYSDIAENTQIKGNYVLEIRPDKAYENLMDEALKEDKFEWHLPTISGALSLGALIGSIAIGTPLIQFFQKTSLLGALTQATIIGTNLAEKLMPCAMNAADMTPYVAQELDKKGIILRNPEALAKLSDMRIGKDKEPYHLLIDFNGTLTQGSEVHQIKNDKDEKIDNGDISKIMQPIIALGEKANKIHHIHTALKAQYPNVNADEVTLEDDNITTIEGKGCYYIGKDETDPKTYAIGSQGLIDDVIEKLYPVKDSSSLFMFETSTINPKKKALKDQLKALKEKETSTGTSTTFMMVNDTIYALETKPKIRTDAKEFLEKHKGKFTVLSGGTIPDAAKEALGLTADNCFEKQTPEGKTDQAKTVLAKKKNDLDQVVAFGDGGNDWNMFKNANIAIQMADTQSENITDFAHIFSDATLNNLSDFTVLNETAQKSTAKNNFFRNLAIISSLGSESMTAMIAPDLEDNPLYNTVHHLGSQGYFNRLAQRTSTKITQDTDTKDTDKNAPSSLFNKIGIVTLTAVTALGFRGNMSINESAAKSAYNALRYTGFASPLISEVMGLGSMINNVVTDFLSKEKEDTSTAA